MIQGQVHPGFVEQMNGVDYSHVQQGDKIMHTELHHPSHTEQQTGVAIHSSLNQPPPFTTTELEDPDYIIKMTSDKDYVKTEAGLSDAHTLKASGHHKLLSGPQYTSQSTQHTHDMITEHGLPSHQNSKSTEWASQSKGKEYSVTSGVSDRVSARGGDYVSTGSGGDDIMKTKKSVGYTSQGTGVDINMQKTSNVEYTSFKSGIAHTVTSSGNSYTSTD